MITVRSEVSMIQKKFMELNTCTLVLTEGLYSEIS